MFSQTIFWDKTLLGPFNLLIDFSSLKTYEVIRQIEFSFNRLPEVNSEHIVFIVRGKLSIISAVADAVKFDACNRTKGTTRQYHILLVPRGSLICEKRLSDFGARGDFDSVIDFPVLFPLDYDVLSLEDADAFCDITIERDTSALYDLAAAITTMQSSFGKIPTACGIGKSAQTVADLMKRMAVGMQVSPQQTSKIDSVFLIDRAVDLITPLLTQHTYEGLIDENFGISQTNVKFPREKFAQPESPTHEPLPETIQFALNSGEDIFAKLRDKNFKAVGPFLNQTSKQLTSVKTETNQAKSVKELKQVVAKVPYFLVAKKSVSNHIAIAELIKGKIENQDFFETTDLEKDLLSLEERDREIDTIEHKLFRCEDIFQVLRLICLQALTTGIRRSAYEAYRKEMLQSYGYAHLLTLISMEKAGILRPPAPSNYIPLLAPRTYPTLSKILSLTDPKAMQKFNDQVPNLYHVYNGYAPLSVKLVERFRRMGAPSLTDGRNELKSLLGCVFEERLVPGRDSGSPVATVRPADETKVVLVVFIGGCTFAEISALRLLSQQEDQSVEFVILTTNIINPKSFIRQFSKSFL